MHCGWAGASIERVIMIRCLFIDAGRICREFVVEAVQQDALTSKHQPFRIGTAEVERLCQGSAIGMIS